MEKKERLTHKEIHKGPEMEKETLREPFLSLDGIQADFTRKIDYNDFEIPVTCSSEHTTKELWTEG